MISNLFYCEHCSEVFTNTTGDFTEHMNSHAVIKNVFACRICEKKLFSQAKLNEHVRIHTGEKPLKCAYCPEAFRAKRHLIEHNKLHNGKGFTCSICHKSFTDKRYFENHERIHTGEKPFKCSYCDKCYHSASGLFKHHRTHTTPKPYACKYCKQTFAEQRHCETHMKFHDRNRTYTCEVCNEKFNYPRSLIKHLRVHSGEKRFSCEQCKKTFVTRKRLHGHYNLYHPNENSEECDVLSTPVETALKDHVYFQTVRRYADSHETINDAIASNVGLVNNKNLTEKEKNFVKKADCVEFSNDIHVVNLTNKRKTVSKCTDTGAISPVPNTTFNTTQESKDSQASNMDNVENSPVLGKDSPVQAQSANLEEHYESCMDDYSTSAEDNSNEVMHADPSASEKIKSNNYCTESGSNHERMSEQHTGYHKDHVNNYAVLPGDVSHVNSSISHAESEGNYIDDLQTFYFKDSFNNAQGYIHSLSDHTYCKEQLTEDSTDYKESIEPNGKKFFSCNRSDSKEKIEPNGKRIFSYTCSDSRKSIEPNGKKIFSCAHCSKTFDHSRYLLGHLLLHMGNDVCQCEHCIWKRSIRKHVLGKFENTINAQINHKNIFRNYMVDSDNQNNQPYSKNSCQGNKNSIKKVYNQSNAFPNYAVTPLKPSQLNLKEKIARKCDQDENTSNHLDDIDNSQSTQGTLASNPKSHLNIIKANNKIFECKECNKSYASRNGIAYHREKNHTRVPYSCKHCFKQFIDHIEYKKHLLMHKSEKKFTCQYCQRPFRQKNNLNCHLRIHTGERPYSCVYCEKSFRVKETLSSHMKMHTGKNLHPCDYCDKKFVHKFSLSEHIRIHTGEKPYVCPHCHRAFSRIFSYNNHLKLHALPRPFLCHYCKKSFATKQRRDNHLKFHEYNRGKVSEQVFSCSFCKKTFCYKQSLEKHIKTHSNESFACLYCKKKFTYENCLKKHVITVHKQPFKETSETMKLATQNNTNNQFPDDALTLLLQLADIPVTDVYFQTT